MRRGGIWRKEAIGSGMACARSPGDLNIIRKAEAVERGEASGCPV